MEQVHDEKILERYINLYHIYEIFDTKNLRSDFTNMNVVRFWIITAIFPITSNFLYLEPFRFILYAEMEVAILFAFSMILLY